MKPRKKDGSFNSSEYQNALDQATQIRKRQLGIKAKQEKLYLIEYFSMQVSVSEYKILKPYIKHTKTLIQTILFICSNLDQS